MNLLVTDFT